MIKLGIIGPDDSIQRIKKIVDKSNYQIIPYYFTYARAEEITEIINENQSTSSWLFSGQIPYYFAKQNHPELVGHYPYLNGSSLSNILIDIAYRDKYPLEKISFDTIPSQEVIEVFNERQIPTHQLKLFPYEGIHDVNQLINFHINSYESQQVSCCVTGVVDVYNHLVKLGIPSYRLIPSTLAIQHALEKAINIADINELTKAKIAVVFFHIQSKENQTTLQQLRFNLYIQEQLIYYAEETQGLFINMSDEQYIVVTTQGSFYSSGIKKLDHLIMQINSQARHFFHIGVGFGETVAHAEENAKKAMQSVKQSNQDTWFIIDEKGEIFQAQELNKEPFIIETTHPLLIRKLNEASLSVQTYSKCLYAQYVLQKGYVTANDLSNHLQMSARNARRILNELLQSQLAEVIGEEMSAERGRPRRLVKILSVEQLT